MALAGSLMRCGPSTLARRRQPGLSLAANMATDNPTIDNHTPTSWWGDFKLDNEQSRFWQIGPLTLIVRCLSGEWQIAHERKGNVADKESVWETRDTDQLPETLDKYSRYIFQKTTGLLNIAPQLPDRPIVSRPHTPFYLSAGEEVTVYVSSPLWLQLMVGSPARELESIAIQRPSDTWFGPSTLEGELCYATTTHCRINLEDIPIRQHRAITPVFICNQADTTLAVERLNVPAPFLPLYTSSSGQLWSPKVTLIREKDGDMANLKIDNRPPAEAKHAVQLGNPRKTADSSVLFRAFNAVFS